MEHGPETFKVIRFPSGHIKIYGTVNDQVLHAFLSNDLIADRAVKCMNALSGIENPDVHLIKAAPALLAALEKAERYIWEVACETEDGVYTLLEDVPEAKLWKEITAAIAKARGEL
jgi:hypothetical protein